jgi:hypothetical protein
LNQDLIDSVITLMGVKNGKVIKIPGSHGSLPEDIEENLSPADHSLYRTVVGKLLYIATERPDMQYAVKERSRSLSSPTQGDMKELKKLARYLAGTMDVVLELNVDASYTMGSVTVKGCSDSDWAKNRHDRKSTTGGAIFVWGCAVLTFARTQPCLALASAEAELYGLSTVIMECKGIATFLEELGEFPMIEGHCDATAAIAIASRLGLAKLKHIEIRHLWLQDEIREGRLVLHKIDTKVNPADILTKILDATDHVRIAALVGITLVWPAVRGRGPGNTNDVQALGRFLQLITLAASAYQSEASEEETTTVGHFVWDLTVYIVCTVFPLILALLALKHWGMIQIVQTIPEAIPQQATRKEMHDATTQTALHHTLELHDVTAEGLKKVCTRLGLTGGIYRTMLKDDMVREIRANPNFMGVKF